MEALRNPKSQLTWLSDLGEQAAGGKASGLKNLLDWQLPCPNCFVILNAAEPIPAQDLQAFYQQLGAGRVAVRSSASGEDGEQTSFAGQYETLLNIEGMEQLQGAIAQCADSLHSERANAYQQGQHKAAGSMSVVVQTMVDAAVAGVLFTVDPVSNRYDRLIIDAVAGLGEALVSGEATPDHYEFDESGALCFQEWVGDSPLLTEEQQQQLIVQARKAEKLAGHPLDLEWVIDQRGQLFWVQARPITTLASDLREFDTQVPAGEVVTRCNIGEMMPGACCPLTLSITGRGIEQGMQHMHLSYAGRPAITDDWTQVAISHGQMFINLSGGAVASASVLGVTVESMGLNICGRIVPGLTGPPAKSFLTRVIGFIRLIRYVLAADSSIDALKADLNHFEIDMSGDSASLIQAIDDAIPMLHRVYRVHLQSSATSGFTGSILQAMLARESKEQADQDAEVARLLAGATQVESAVLVDELDEISRSILKLASEHAGAFAELPTESALDWLEKQAPEKVKSSFNAFLHRHGHRGYRELCLRQPSWSQDPEELVVTIQTSVKAQLNNATTHSRPEAADLSKLSKSLRWVVKKAHKAIRRRETTKSLLVLTTHKLSRAYRRLGEYLVEQDVLADIDQVFFFSHEELKLMLSETADTSTNAKLWMAKADKRRRALEFQNKLQFEEVCYGQPQPLDIHKQTADHSAEISGRAVSPGVVEGFARVAHSVQEASALQAGEILVAPITDVGWTPYFNLIAGLVTDLGSSVSHGAVIAREYGLPAIVNTRLGTRKIATGDFIRLNADNGTVERLKTSSPDHAGTQSQRSTLRPQDVESGSNT